eukprot:1160844-Lingulodinium_polyedra.AAC.1
MDWTDCYPLAPSESATRSRLEQRAPAGQRGRGGRPGVRLMLGVALALATGPRRFGPPAACVFP